MLNIGVIGYGYWGPNLVRNFVESEHTQVLAVADKAPNRLRLVESRYPNIQTSTDVRALLDNPKIDAIVVATPVSSHYDLAMQALKAGKHVLVEKPLASTSEQAIRMVDEAQRRKLTLMVDHTFVYTSAVRKIADLVAKGEIGQPYYYDSVRINLGLFQHDVNVLWDLAVHDLSILQYVIPCDPVAISATGMSHFSSNSENIAYLTMFFPDNLIAHIHVNWLAPVKVRRTLIGGSRRMVIYDDVEGSEKVKVYDKGVHMTDTPESVAQFRVNYRAGDMWAPQIDNTEALKVEVEEFVDAIHTGREPLTGGEAGLKVVRILEAATHSMAVRGQVVELAQGVAL